MRKVLRIKRVAPVESETEQPLVTFKWLTRVAQIARGHPMRSFTERWKMSQVACNVVCRYGCKNLRKVRR
jgi:hypothetical protein